MDFYQKYSKKETTPGAIKKAKSGFVVSQWIDRGNLRLKGITLKWFDFSSNCKAYYK